MASQKTEMKCLVIISHLVVETNSLRLWWLGFDCGFCRWNNQQSRKFH